VTKSKDVPLPAPSPLLDQEKAASLLGGISPRTLERWRSQGKGPRYVKLGKRVFYRPEDLAAFIERNLRAGTYGEAR
jgi:predicted site-specific integrase-resolvase